MLENRNMPLSKLSEFISAQEIINRFTEKMRSSHAITSLKNFQKSLESVYGESVNRLEQSEPDLYRALTVILHAPLQNEEDISQIKIKLDANNITDEWRPANIAQTLDTLENRFGNWLKPIGQNKQALFIMLAQHARRIILTEKDSCTEQEACEYPIK
jgi:hypothetical protein